jgi:hypothetical protein
MDGIVQKKGKEKEHQSDDIMAMQEEAMLVRALQVA